MKRNYAIVRYNNERSLFTNVWSSIWSSSNYLSTAVIANNLDSRLHLYPEIMTVSSRRQASLSSILASPLHCR